MRITFDPAKRAKALAERGLDFADAGKVFAGRHATRESKSSDAGDPRYVTAGYLDDRFVVIVWTPRSEGRHIISMRHGHAKEEKLYRDILG